MKMRIHLNLNPNVGILYICPTITSATVFIFDIQLFLSSNSPLNINIIWPYGENDTHSTKINKTQNYCYYYCFIQLKANLKSPIEGLVILSYGAGNFPTQQKDLMDIFRNAIQEENLIIVNVSQCNHGSVNASYETGQVLPHLTLLLIYSRENFVSGPIGKILKTTKRHLSFIRISE